MSKGLHGIVGDTYEVFLKITVNVRSLKNLPELPQRKILLQTDSQVLMGSLHFVLSPSTPNSLSAYLPQGHRLIRSGAKTHGPQSFSFEWHLKTIHQNETNLPAIAIMYTTAILPCTRPTT